MVLTIFVSNLVVAFTSKTIRLVYVSKNALFNLSYLLMIAQILVFKNALMILTILQITPLKLVFPYAQKELLLKAQLGPVFHTVLMT